MSILTQLTAVDVTALQELLREHTPTAVWHATGVRGGYRRQFDTASHQMRAPPELERRLRDMIYGDTPGLYSLLAYHRNSASTSLEHRGAHVVLEHTCGALVVMFERARRLSVFILLGVPESLLRHYNPVKEDQ